MNKTNESGLSIHTCKTNNVSDNDNLINKTKNGICNTEYINTIDNDNLMNKNNITTSDKDYENSLNITNESEFNRYNYKTNNVSENDRLINKN